MKATFYLPAHPSYFPDIDCRQDDIESALVRYDRFMGGKLFKGDAEGLIKHEYALLRKPGKSIQVVFHSTGMGDGEDVSDEEKAFAIAQFRRTSDEELRTHVQNIREHLKMPQLDLGSAGLD
jgi:hypothetical protein